MNPPLPHVDEPVLCDDLADTAKDPLQQTLAHRFRHTLYTGQVSPLLHLVLRYRQEVRPCQTPS